MDSIVLLYHILEEKGDLIAFVESGYSLYGILDVDHRKAIRFMLKVKIV